MTTEYSRSSQADPKEHSREEQLAVRVASLEGVLQSLQRVLSAKSPAKSAVEQARAIVSAALAGSEDDG